MRSYIPRLLDPAIESVLGELPALMLVGPRATGKTTTALRYARSVLRLDRPGVAAVVAADPDASLRDLDEPVLVDEWQLVPDVLGAVKRAVDSDALPGRFILTGSSSAASSQALWPATGRVIRLTMYGMTVKERLGQTNTQTFIHRAVEGSWVQPADPPDLRGYVELALSSGFPETVPLGSSRVRRLWLTSFLDQMITRDAVEEGRLRDPSKLRRYIEALALASGETTDHKTIFEAAGVSKATGTIYEGLLQDLLVLEKIPAWSSNRFKRLMRAPKRYLIEPALMATALGVDVRGFMSDAGLLGRLIESFAIAQLRPELAAGEDPAVLYHLRKEGGAREVDALVELGGGRLVAVEIKASSAPNADDGRHLAWLRDELGNRFVAGVVLHTGPKIFTLGDRITAVPICAFWS